MTAVERMIDWLRDVRYFQPRDIAQVRNRLNAIRREERRAVGEELAERLRLRKPAFPHPGANMALYYTDIEDVCRITTGLAPTFDEERP